MTEYKECPKHLDTPDPDCIECIQNLKDYCGSNDIKLIGDDSDLNIEE